MKILRSLLSNLATLILAFIMAIFIWVYATRADDPINRQALQTNVQFVGLPESATLVRPNRQTVQVGFEGRASILTELTPEDINAAADLSNVPFGEETAVPIDVQVNKPGITVIFQSPEQANVLVEQLVTREILVVADVRGSVARGYTQAEPLVDPESITIAGTESQVELINNARVTVFLNNDRETVTRTTQPIFYDNQGEVVGTNNLEISDNQVTVTIPVDESAGFAEKFVTIDLVGEPAPGYRLLGAEVEPAAVLLSGPSTVLNQFSLVETEPVDITGLTGTFSQPVTLDLPNGVSLAEVQQISVTVSIEPFMTSAIYNRPVEVQGLEEGLTVEIDPETVRIILFGPLPALNTLLEDEIRASVDLFDLEEGVYSIAPTVSLPEQRGIEVRSLQPEQVTVVITQAMTMTGTLTDTLPITDTIPITDTNSYLLPDGRSAPTTPAPTPGALTMAARPSFAHLPPTLKESRKPLL